MILHPLLSIIPEDQQYEVFNQDRCDIDGEFIGFTDIYESLSKIIPVHFTVVDLGCAYNPQCYYFINHKQYIAVDDNFQLKRFKTPNCTLYNMSINDFILYHLDNLDLDKTFAICSYVPTNRDMIRTSFKNLFIYYPSSVLPKLTRGATNGR